MSVFTNTQLWRFQRVGQVAAMGAFATLAVGLAGATLLSALGVLPWLQLTVFFDDGSVWNAGMAVQIALAVLAVLLCAYMPSNMRVLALENSHRDFRIRMEDVANAYWATHAADRTGIFKMTSEFDAVKERMLFLRDHPDLGHLKPEVLEIAAQMSRISADLAETYSDDAVARATDFLAQREREADEMQTRIEAAQAAATELRRWNDRVELEEAVAKSQMQRLRETLDELLPQIGLELSEPARDETPSDVIPLPRPTRRTRAIPAE